jgi:uncharacterized protein (DUF1015 family)
MANIFPFPALRYNPDKVEPKDVLTQPYDKITPAMQEKYYARSPYNLVRVILGKAEAGDDENKNVYSRAAENLRHWREAGVLIPDAEPSIYYYSQEFTAPGESRTRTRSGFIAAGQLHDYEERVVFRHEQTLSKPKSDRLNLLRATRTHAGQIFMLYTDTSKQVEQQLQGQGSPVLDLVDDYGVRNRLWKISDPKTNAAVQAAMKDKKLIIADGHHRYETALNYRNERRATAKVKDPNAAYERVMMTFVNTEDSGLVILPTHRVVHGLAGFLPADFDKKTGEAFVATQGDSKDPVASLATGESGTRLVAVTKEGTHLLRARPQEIAKRLAKFSAAQRELDVLVLHKILLEGVLGMTEESIRNQEHISYIRDAGEAMARVGNGDAQIAFLINPVRIEQMTAVAFAGDVMPQKSTDFYPKLLSGLAFYSVD